MKNLLSIFMFIVCPYLYGQTINIPIVPKEISIDHINKYDSIGNKCGYWCEISDDIITFNYYSSGKKDGVSQVYRKTSSDKYYLQASGYYKEDIPCSQWQYYYKNGMISMIQSRITENRDFLKEAKELGFYTPNHTLQCYIITYDKNGNISSEGWCVFQQDVESDGQEVGRWIYHSHENINH